MAGAVLVLANPAIVEEERKGLPDVAVIVADQTQSQAIGDRSKTVDDTVAKLRAKLTEHKDLDIRVITVTEDRAVQDGGTALFGPLNEAFADVPPDRIAGAILVTDGQVHDIPTGAAAKLGYPVHAMLTDADFLSAVCVESGDLSHRVAATPDHSAVERTMRTPSVVQRFLGDTLTLLQDIRWNAPAADGSRTGTLSTAAD